MKGQKYTLSMSLSSWWKNNIYLKKSHNVKRWRFMSSFFVVCKSNFIRWRKALSSFSCSRLPCAQNWKALQTDVAWRCLEHFCSHGPLWREKKNELNYVIFLLIGFTGIFSKPLFIFIGGEGNDMPLKYQPWSAYEGKENILVISLPFQFRYRALAQLFCTQWICYEMLNFFFILVLLWLR